MHRVATDLLWLTLGVYIGALVIRELSILTADLSPSLSKALEFPFGTGVQPASQ